MFQRRMSSLGTPLAQGLCQDKATVKNAVKLFWSNGPVEGQVNRLKMLKRSMYGRAGFPLLRVRVLPLPARLSKDYELKVQSSEEWILIAMVRLVLRRLGKAAE